MVEIPQIKYRRRKTSFTFHHREDCKRFPVKDYIEDQPIGNNQFQMICNLCKALDRADEFMPQNLKN